MTTGRKPAATRRRSSPSGYRAGSNSAARVAPGRRCPACRRGTLIYNTLWQLVCDRCGRIADGGTFS